VDVRVIAATNRPLEEMIKTGQFREDLYYRLNVVKIHLPPLRERRADIPLLAQHFIRRFAKLNDKSISGISKEAMDLLIKYALPGNVRELENIVEQAVVLAREEMLTTFDLPTHLHGTASESAEASKSSGSFQQRVEAFEKDIIRQALREANGVQTKAAALLGMTERHLRYKLQKYGMK